ncbi:CheY-like chemotaxis protein [Rhodoblastus acidophilus]|uniref:response regulator n=1 Tax=Rhodoblastus acidophilus TaxID=1074 RepID=UPI001616336C|nr:response regulator [Rhodoblastus acidophilus]MCW2282520.1 CheY-like chemotaxis protein [Rhodoblastus acidophilus]MCW2331381.1 CheY-like chemotaxis protein [Rhodoblastus acidophilus]
MAFIDLSQGARLMADDSPPVRILVVDDDAEDIYLLKRLLRRSKTLAYQVFACGSLDEGAAIAAAEAIDVVLVDFFLGVGVSVDSRRPNHAVLSLPFLLLSGLDAPDLEEVARQAGASGFLDKGGLAVETIDAFALQVLNAARAGLATRRSPEALLTLPD